jgi:hypothetical protein
MYYNINNQQITNSYPSSLTLSNGTAITGETFDTNILIDAGYYIIRNDSPTQPENTIEDISARIINLDKPYVDIVRTWVPIPVVVPETISARQIRLWLIDNNISLNSVEDAINTINDLKLREKTKIEWEYAPYIERNHPLIESLAQYLGLSKEQIDQGFVAAAQL